MGKRPKFGRTRSPAFITLCSEKKDAERYQRETFGKVDEILKPYLTTPITYKTYNVETTVCEHFVKALAV